MNLIPKTYLLWQKLAYFCSIFNCENYALVFRVYLFSRNSWANISTQKKIQTGKINS